MSIANDDALKRLKAQEPILTSLYKERDIIDVILSTFFLKIDPNNSAEIYRKRQLLIRKPKLNNLNNCNSIVNCPSKQCQRITICIDLEKVP